MPARKTDKAKFAAHVMDQLELVPRVSMRPMFGGYGIYCEGQFIALIWQTSLFMFTNEETRKKYKRADMPWFEFKQGQGESNYWMVPPTVLGDKRKLAKYAQEALEARRQSGRVPKKQSKADSRSPGRTRRPAEEF